MKVAWVVLLQMSVAVGGGAALVAWGLLLALWVSRGCHGATPPGGARPLMAGPCRFNAMCSCKGGEAACVGVPFYRLPGTQPTHISLFTPSFSSPSIFGAFS